MPKLVTSEVYKYGELVELGKRKKLSQASIIRAESWLSEACIDGNWYEYVEELWTTALGQIGFIDPKIAFSGFCQQGDGASFTAQIELTDLVYFLAYPIDPVDHIPVVTGPDGKEREDFRGWVVWRICGAKPYPWNPRFRWLANLGDLVTEHEVERTSHHYSHERTCTTNIDIDLPGDLDLEFRFQPKHDRIYRVFRNFCEQAEDLRLDLCRLIYEDLEKEHEHLMSTEHFIEMSDINNWYFTSAGKFVGCIEEGEEQPLPGWTPPQQRKPRRRSIGAHKNKP